MIVAFKGNYSGMILLEALEGERRSGEANERARARVLTEGMACPRDRAEDLRKRFSAPFGTSTSTLKRSACCYESLVCCNHSSSSLVSPGASDSMKKKIHFHFAPNFLFSVCFTVGRWFVIVGFKISPSAALA